jgi:hypothetical protein
MVANNVTQEYLLIADFDLRQTLDFGSWLTTNFSRCFSLYRLGADRTENTTSKKTIFLSDVLRGLLSNDGLVIVDVRTTFGWRENMFTGRFLAMNDFLGPLFLLSAVMSQ